MRKLSAVAPVLTAVLAAGCIQEVDHPIREALPTAEQVAIKLPGATAEATSSPGQGRSALVGETASYYIVTRAVTLTLNGGAAWVLILVHTVVQFPPTTVADTVYTWGPYSGPLDPAEWKLVVTDNLDGSYDWELDGHSKIDPGSAWEAVVTGNAVPGAEPHRGSGSFFMDFDAGERVNPIDNDARGNIAVTYDLENRDGTQASLDMHIASTADDGTPVSFDYHYAESVDRAGDFEFRIHGDLDDGGSLAEEAAIRSRWTADGQGRADVIAGGGDLGDLTVTASECWSTTFARVFYEDSVNWQPTEGDEGQCVFAEAAPPAL
jgi:hypothetical protein